MDSLAFATGCGLAGIAGAAFTTIGSTGPTSGSLYIVDTFLTSCSEARKASRHHRFGLWYRPDPGDRRVLPDGLDGEGSDVDAMS